MIKYEEDLNRVEYEKVTSSFEDAIMENGFMDVVKVFPESDGYYKIAESTHRVRALRNIAGDNQSMEVPVAILNWIDGDNSEDVLSTIVNLNNTGKSWELFDYVKANANAKAKAGDPITCKMKGNEDSELDCFPMCVCHKFAWTLEFQPQLRQEVKTTKLCEHWIQSELMDEACMVTCASVSHAVYGAQGTDPMVCEHVSTELTKVMSFKEERASSTTKKRLGKPGAKSTAAGRKWESLVGKAKWMPKVKPDQKYLVGK